MFFPDNELIRLSYRSGASRFFNRFTNFLSLQKKFKYLRLRKNWKAGRNDSGRIILWTKGKLNHRWLSPRINYNIRCIKLGFISSFQFIPFRNKLISLIFFSNGAVTYYNTPDSFTLFDHIYWNRKKKIRKFYDSLIWSLFFFLKKLIFVCFIEIFPGKGAQYVLGPGTKGKIFAIDKNRGFVNIILPSKVKKFFSIYSVVLLGQNMLYENKFFHNTKSGYWRNFGCKSIVRGVAMNPVDHPHGGRTKAIKHQRTPWGKTTKIK